MPILAEPSPHPFHTSVAEIDWNDESKKWEVSLRIHAGDLELALSRDLRTKFNVESEDAPARIQAYLAQRFLLLPQSTIEKLPERGSQDSSFALPSADVDSAKSGTAIEKDSIRSHALTSQINWVGKELEGNWLWLYFELDQARNEPLALYSQLLTEINEDQINVVSFRLAGKRVARQTNRQQQWVSLQK